VETHGRAETAKLIEGLEVIPRFLQQHRGIIVEEMDVNAILRRKPQVAMVDELAHSNVPGSKNAKRYEDVQDLLAAGIHVVTNHECPAPGESLRRGGKNCQGKGPERLPDSILAEADQIVNVDLTPEDLQERLREGKVYPAERISTAFDNFFKTPNLENLRELTLREMAAQIDLRRHETLPEDGSIVPDQIMVCLSSQGPNSEMLLRYASRLAGSSTGTGMQFTYRPFRRRCRNRQPDTAAVVGSADPGEGTGRHGLYLQRRGYCRHDSALCPGISGRPHRDRIPRAHLLLEKNHGQEEHSRITHGNKPEG